MRWRRGGVAAARGEPVAHPDRPGWGRQDAPGNRGRGARVSAHFADGAAFVDLSPLRDPALVLPTIAQRLGLDERDATPLAGRLATYLRGKRLLLLLDNFEHLVAARDEVLGAADGVPAPDGAGDQPGGAARARRARVPRRAAGAARRGRRAAEALATLAGGALFLERARAVGAELALTAANTTAVAQICRRLDGLPLAIELAAAWARLLPPPALLARLDRRLPLLIGGRARPAGAAADAARRDRLELRPARHAASSASSGGWPSSPVAAHWRRPRRSAPTRRAEPATLAGLAALVDKSLLRRRTTRDAAVEPRLTPAGDAARVRAGATGRSRREADAHATATPPTTWRWRRRRSRP